MGCSGMLAQISTIFNGKKKKTRDEEENGIGLSLLCQVDI